MLNGKFIGVQEKTNVFTIEKKFTIKKIGKATLRATALGLYFAEINDLRVGDAYMMPGWTSYNKMLQVQNFDVSMLLSEGENVIRFTVGRGWYCSGLAWGDRATYGEQSAICAELNIDGNIISTDETWLAKESHIRFSGIYDGEIQNYIAEKKSLTLCKISYDKSKLVEQICEPVKNIERIPVLSVITTPIGEYVYDFGQNITGVVEIQTSENFYGTITLQFGEILVNGNFYSENLRNAKSTDIFTLKGAKKLCPEFTFHGFRYMKIEGVKLPKESITALVRHSDMKRTGYISVNNKRFQKLLNNVVWGQRCNFLDVPTDCPQRDERLGWTGDINAFCRTAAYNYDVRKILKKWLRDLRNDQAETGEIPHVVPDILGDKHTDAMWCDVITMVPWTLYEMYGDISYLSDNYDAMKKFIDARERTMENGLIVRGHEFGDWLALDEELLLGNSMIGRTNVYYITNVFHVNTLKIAMDTAHILGDYVGEKLYHSKRKALLENIQYEYFTASGRLVFDTVTAQVLALYFDIVPQASREKIAKLLNENVIRHNYRMTTGFIGTPYLLFALADNGFFETARRLLLNNSYPGWLYEVDMGATTIWERWNSLMPDGTPNPDGMNSYNHYAYGSMMEFVYRRIAGIQTSVPGFSKIKIAPIPTKGLPEIKAEYDSVKGKIVAGYIQKNGKITFFAEIPEGCEAEIYLPNEGKIASGNGLFSFEREWEELSCEPFTPDSTVNEVFDNPKAVQAFNKVFNEIFEGQEIAWMRADKTLQFMAEFRDVEKKMKLSDFPEMLQKANNIFKELTE